MATLRDLERLALALPSTSGSLTPTIAFSVDGKPKPKGFAWSWKERIDPKKARVENREVIAIRVASLSDKEMLLASDADIFFTEPHYHGYPAVLVRLGAIDVGALEALLAAAWRCQAPKTLVAAHASDTSKASSVKASKTSKTSKASKASKTTKAISRRRATRTPGS